jgi:FkbM family methyltransferase
MSNDSTSELSIDTGDPADRAMSASEVYVPHVGWLSYPAKDEVARFLREGWFEYDLQAFLFLYLRAGNTFIDCGAHVGLYSIMAGKLVGDQGRVISLEPEASNFTLLKQNLNNNGVACATPIHAAVFSRSGSMRLYVGPAGRSAYCRLVAPESPENTVGIEALTIDEIFERCGVDRPAVVKVDVEGSEIQLLDGIRQSNLPVLVVEFTEINLNRAGSTTKELYRKLELRGYQICRFDLDRQQLEPVEFAGPVWHANYFAVKSLTDVNSALQLASQERRRIAEEILERGKACEQLHKIAQIASGSAGALEKSLDELNGAYRRVGEATWRADQANGRVDQALSQLNEAYRRVGEATWRADQANGRVDQALSQLNEAYRQVGEANWRADRAGQRADELLRHLNEANQRADQAIQRSNDAIVHLSTISRPAVVDECFRLREERDYLNSRLVEVTESFRLSQARLQEIANSRFVQMGRRAGILKARWLDRADVPGVNLQSPAPELAPSGDVSTLPPVDRATNDVDTRSDDMDRLLKHLAWRGFRPKVLLDVGAAKGWWSVRAAAIFPEAQVFMIDPLAEHEPFLKRLSDDDPRFHYLRTAVGDQTGDSIMNITADEEASSLLSWDGEDPSRQRRVPVATLDQLMAEGKVSAPDLVKIDVQGFELRVLQGAGRACGSAEVFIIEVNLYEFMHACPRAHEIIAFLAQRGYYLFDVAGSLRRPLDNNLAQMDLVFTSSNSFLSNDIRWG